MHFFIAFVLSALLCLPFLFQQADSEQQRQPVIDDLYAEQESEAFDALTFLSAMNAYPNADIPADGYNKAWIRHQEIKALPNTAGIRNAWQDTNFLWCYIFHVACPTPLPLSACLVQVKISVRELKAQE